MIVEAEVAGPTRTWQARLVLDTGAAATTLTPQVVERIGYSRRDGYKKARVHTAIGEELGYWLRVAEFTVLDEATPDFALTVFPLGHKDIDGLVGMNFLRHFNVEIRPEERLIHLELIKRCSAEIIWKEICEAPTPPRRAPRAAV
jgi:predicted aspartyl protease